MCRPRRVMVIEHAERFGLAQLHQLRGRVGRGSDASFCLLLHEEWVNDAARRRLTLLRDTEDGFLIADEDFRLRGGGDILGTKQSGLPGFRLADPIEHEGLLHMAHRDAAVLLEKDPKLASERGTGGARAAAAVRTDGGDADAGGGVRWSRTGGATCGRNDRNRFEQRALANGLQQTKHLQFAPQRRRQGILAPGTSPEDQISRRLVGTQVAPSLEWLGGPAGERHQLRIQQQAGARGAVVAAVLDDVDDPLPHQHAAADHPVHRAAVDHLLVAAGKAAGAMAQRRTAYRALRLKFAQVVDVAHTDGELGEMQHGLATRSSF